MSATRLQQFNIAATVLWILMVPIVLLTSLKTSITFLVFISIYAIVISHYSAYAAGRVEKRQEVLDADD